MRGRRGGLLALLLLVGLELELELEGWGFEMGVRVVGVESGGMGIGVRG